MTNPTARHTSKLADSFRKVINISDDDEQDVTLLEESKISAKANKEHAEPIFCQFCGRELTRESIESRQEHYENHPDNDYAPQPVASGSTSEVPNTPNTSSTKADNKKRSRSKSTPRKSQDTLETFWYQSQEVSPPQGFTPGLIPILRKALLHSHAKGTTTRAVLCYEGAVHVATQTSDMGWGCGYRNFLMACTALYDQKVQPEYFPALDSPLPPSVRNLQRWLENAWAEGFDEDGAKQLKHKIVGTSKWIGTADLYVAFISRAIPARLVDFPKVEKGAELVLRWVEQYFASPKFSTPAPQSPSQSKSNSFPMPNDSPSRRQNALSISDALRGASPVVCTERMPIVLQHDGHSRTIVGYEKCKDGSVNLLVFDPSHTIPEPLRRAALSHARIPTEHGSPKRSLKEKTSKFFKKVVHPQKRSSPTTNKPTSNSSTSSNKKPRLTVDLTNVDTVKTKNSSSGVRGGDIAEVIVLSDEETEATLDDDEPREDDDDVEIQEVREDARVGNQDRQEETEPLQKADLLKYLNTFRLKPSAVGKKNQYQILYFPLDGLMSDKERSARKVVTAEVVR